MQAEDHGAWGRGVWCTWLLWMLISVKWKKTGHVRVWNQELGILDQLAVIFHETECVCAFMWEQAWQASGYMLSGWRKDRVRFVGTRWMGLFWAPPWWRGEEMHSHIPSCASAAVLVVGAAGLVCCRPTIGQRGVQLDNATENMQPLRECDLTHIQAHYTHLNLPQNTTCYPVSPKTNEKNLPSHWKKMSRTS